MPEKSIHDLVKMFLEGDISIPELQREFVWTPEKVKDLVDSIYKNYPIGVITLFRLPRELRVRYNTLYWVIDGQQRLLSLTLILYGKIKLRGDIIKEMWIWFNPEDERFRISTPPRELKHPWVKLSDFLKLDRQEFNNFIRDKPSNQQEKIEKIWANFRDYRIFCHEITEELDIDSLGEIFVRTNFAGTRVKGTDVYSTMIAVSEPGLVTDLREFSERLDWEIDYGVLVRIFIAFASDGKVKLASKVLDQAKKLREIFNKTNLRDILPKVKENVERSIEFLKEFGIMKPNYKFLPSENILVTIAYYLHRKGEISEDEKKGLFIWFVLASEFGRYSSATETRLNEDLLIIKEGKDYRALIDNIEKREGNIKDRIKEKIQQGNVSLLLLYLLLMEKEAKDLNEPHESLHTGEITQHHIFPKSRLKGTKWENLIDDIGNITLVRPGTNFYIGNDIPEMYLKKIPEEIRLSHFIPNDIKLWKIEKIEKFIEERKKLLIKEFEKVYTTYVKK